MAHLDPVDVPSYPMTRPYPVIDPKILIKIEIENLSGYRNPKYAENREIQ